MSGGSNDKCDFFVSFNEADRAWATWIAWVLEEVEYSVIFQDWDFRGNFVLEMDEALKRSTRMVAVLSPDFLASNFTAPEWAARFAQDPRSSQGLLIPVRVRECELEGLLAQVAYADLTGCEEAEGQRRLLARVKKAVDAGYRAKPATRPGFPGGSPRQVPKRPRFPIAEHNLPQPNRAFVGRSAELEALRHALMSTGRSTITQPKAITGLGGIGKTQLALRYAYKHLGDYGLIHWVRAENPAALAVDYAGIARALDIDMAQFASDLGAPNQSTQLSVDEGPKIPDRPDLIAAVRDRLERCDRWLLVFDNATVPTALEPYLPRTGSGHVLITSRWQSWEGTADAFELAAMPAQEAVLLLLGDDADNPEERAAAGALADELGRLPLALAHARAFMRARKMGVDAYRQQLDAARRKVLAWRPASASYPFAVAQAWQVSVDQAARDCLAARDLLSLLAFFAPDAISRDL